MVFVIEFKVNEKKYTQSAIDPVIDFIVDLKNFHEASHTVPLVSILVATEFFEINNLFEKLKDDVFKPILCNDNNIIKNVKEISISQKELTLDP